MFLVAIDAHSKWPEVVKISTSTATQTVTVLGKMFAANRLPEQCYRCERARTCLFIVQMSSGLPWKWHMDHLCAHVEIPTQQGEPDEEQELFFSQFCPRSTNDEHYCP